MLETKNISKQYPGTLALNHINVSFDSGRVHAFVGKNGSGKSTLLKVFSGAISPTSGEYFLDGKEMRFNSPKNAFEKGIATVYQDLSLVPGLNVAENILLGRMPMKHGMINWKEGQRIAKDILDELQLDIPVDILVKDLSAGNKQMVEIAKSLSHENTNLLVLDEPSAALTESEIEDLFVFIRRLKATGVGIIYISHRMNELKEITDRITVMRDGQYVNTVDTAETTIDQVVQMMVGRVIYEEPKTQSNVPEGAPIVFEAEELVSKDVKGVSFNLKKGEILGFAGLMGAGRTETARLICGADPRHGGTIRINGKEVRINSPRDAVAAGIGYLSEDRKRYGLCLGLSVADNTVLASLDQFSKVAFVDDRKIEGVSHEYVKKVRTKTPSVKSKVRSLSGGNQQKVVLSKWLLNNCDILIFDEPTRGIDVGAKSEIYKLMHQLADDGKSIIMISSEMPELLRMSDRIVVMCEGRKTGELDIAEATQEKIMTLATKREVG